MDSSLSPLPQVEISTAAMQAGVSTAQPALQARCAVMAAEVLTLTKRLNSSLADTFGTDDLLATVTGKGLLDAVGTVDDLPAMAIVKQLTDVVASLDLINAEIVAYRAFDESATSLDSQLVSVIKVLTDLCTAVEAVAVGVTKPLADTTACSDASTLLTGKALQDLVLQTETRAMAITKGLQDSVTRSETGTLTVQSYAADVSYFAEYYTGSVFTF